MATPKYNIIDKGETNPSHVEIIDHPVAAGLIYMYGKVGFSELKGIPVMRFVYEVVSNPNNIDPEQPSVRQLMGDILVENLESNLKDGVLVFGK